MGHGRGSKPITDTLVKSQARFGDVVDAVIAIWLVRKPIQNCAIFLAGVNRMGASCPPAYVRDKQDALC